LTARALRRQGICRFGRECREFLHDMTICLGRRAILCGKRHGEKEIEGIAIPVFFV
jgi:hypothetical protein